MAVKLEVLKRFANGDKAEDVARALGLASTTVRTIRDRDSEKIKEAARSATSLTTKTITRARSSLMLKME